MNININEGVILGWAPLNGCIIVDDVLGDHASDSLVAAVEPMSSSIHDSGRLATLLLKDCKIGWDIELDVTAAASV